MLKWWDRKACSSLLFIY